MIDQTQSLLKLLLSVISVSATCVTSGACGIVVG
jgi:hypothetical protein